LLHQINHWQKQLVVYGKNGAAIIALGAMFSVAGTLNAIMLVGSRLPFAFSEKQFPSVSLSFTEI
jgi:amino acid transporter